MVLMALKFSINLSTSFELFTQYFSVKMPATQHHESLNEQDKKKFIKDAIFHILAQECKRPLLKKADIFNAIGLTGHAKTLQAEILRHTVDDLKEVFGYELKELDDVKDKKKKGHLILVNTIEDSSVEDLRHLKLSEKEEAHLGLLTVVLSVIYMNNNSIKEDALFGFLERYLFPIIRDHPLHCILSLVDPFERG